MPTVLKTSERKKLRRLANGLTRTAATTLEIFNALAHDAEVFYIWTSSKPIHNGRTLSEAKDIAAALAWRRKKKQLRKLRHLRLIERRREGGRLIDVLTAKGLNLKLKLQIRAASKSPDGTMTMVSYDIPEDARVGRDAFRRLLKSNGFKMKHRSFWIIEKDIAEPLRQLVRRYNLGKWVDIRTGPI